jgi:Flp pilus assembly protein TadG
MRSSRARQRGATMLEFTLVGIGLIFVFLSFFEVARGMWTYQTLSYAVREGARYSSVHGKDCTLNGANCTVTVSQIATVIRSAGVGLDPDNTSVSLTTNGGTATTDTITNLVNNYTGTNWPPSSDYAPGQNVKVTATYPFRTFLAMGWVGHRGVNYSGVFTLGASSTETIQY